MCAAGIQEDNLKKFFALLKEDWGVSAEGSSYESGYVNTPPLGLTSITLRMGMEEGALIVNGYSLPFIPDNAADWFQRMIGLLMKEFQLPKHTRFFEISLPVDDVVTMKVEYLPSDLTKPSMAQRFIESLKRKQA
jgi:hypothetical protein